MNIWFKIIFGATKYMCRYVNLVINILIVTKINLIGYIISYVHR